MNDDHLTLGFPKTPEEAEERFPRFEHVDPLHEVPPALLNSGDIYDYARITGMIWPFDTSERRVEKKLKSASYEIDFLGEVYFFDDNKGKHDVLEIRPNVPFTLPKNSIAFVFLATKFRLPDYIALRFNLKITHVHRGLLLGTGPLVDPGFVGRLLIPLHNLTSKDYTIIGGEGLIWVEFTKLSGHNHWDSDARQPARDYAHFPPTKRNMTAQQYFNRASEGTPAISSIPVEIGSIKKWVTRLTWSGVIGGIAFLFGLLLPTWSLISDAGKNVVDSGKVLSSYQLTVDELKEKVETLEAKLTSLQQAARAPNNPQPQHPQTGDPRPAADKKKKQ